MYKRQVRRQVAYYKRHRKLFQYGTFYRVDAPLDKKKTIWTVVSPDRTEAVAGWYQVLEQPTYGEDMLKTDVYKRQQKRLIRPDSAGLGKIAA